MYQHVARVQAGTKFEPGHSLKNTAAMLKLNGGPHLFGSSDVSRRCNGMNKQRIRSRRTRVAVTQSNCGEFICSAAFHTSDFRGDNAAGGRGVESCSGCKNGERQSEMKWEAEREK